MIASASAGRRPSSQSRAAGGRRASLYAHSSVEGTLVCGPDYRIISIDAHLAAALGYAPQDLVGRRAIDLVAMVHRPRVMVAADSVRQGREDEVTVPCGFIAHTGVVIVARLTVRPVIGSDAHMRPGISAHVLLDDISALRRDVPPDPPSDGPLDAEEQLSAWQTHAGPRPEGSRREGSRRDRRRPAAARSLGATSEPAVHRGASASPVTLPQLGRLLESVTTAASAVASLLADVQTTLGVVLASGDATPAPTDAWPQGPEQPPARQQAQHQSPAQQQAETRPQAETQPQPRDWPPPQDQPRKPSDTDAGDFDLCAEDLGSAERFTAQVHAVLGDGETGFSDLSASRGTSDRAWREPLQERDIDSLTGLATRAKLVEELAEIAVDAGDVAVLLVDLDEFKQVNDLHGHDVGDEVLTHVAKRLRLCVRPDDLVVRFGGDEFVILCRNAAAATVIAGRIVDLLSTPIGTAVGALTITCSVGISDDSIAFDVPADLLTRADAAMYWAKRAGKNQYFRYDADLHERTLAERSIERLLRRAVLERRIKVEYQPIMAANGIDVAGVESVARLIDDDGEIRMPAEFLPIAERSGLIGAIDAWVLTEACRCISGVARSLDLPLAVSVNVSAQFVTRSDLVEIVTSALRSAGMPPSTLMIEIPEGGLDRIGPAALEQLTRLRGLGVRVALDGFGAGDAPLSVLRHLPLSHIKVDRPCLSRVLIDDRDAAMIEAVTWLVDKLGLTWIAEGVETAEQWQAVQRFGPGMAQGFLFAGPLSEDDLRHTLLGAIELGMALDDPGRVSAGAKETVTLRR